ncbi:PREDICTED: major histocompatibility complex class I-related gene protein-like [Cyprinodon variegatus]|uniref:major histocompatibility complex class I-related gene protein-like n=1 Tax=Cyprinodon variegatus TaxID=28743 RepID=UPI000742BAEA|nr:PREDICTED: major histocompatibility complex class I-related gene protein-like [Cyprinodon variegatus]
MNLFLFYLFCQFLSAEKHSLKFLMTGSSGLSNFPELEITVMGDDNSVAVCDSRNKSIKHNYDWVDKFLKDDPGLHDWFNLQCFAQLPYFRDYMSALKKQFRQQEGVHFLQLISSCETDEETQNVNAVLLYGYDKEDLIALDFKTLTWIALKPEAIPFKRVWDTERERILLDQRILMQMCPEWVKRGLKTGKDFLLRTEHPSLFLLQKTPTSPVTCHATGFYPKRALMFWRKEGEEIHEDVEHGEILPNDDGTFQMRVYLNISSISLEDWKRYVCVFQLIDKEEKIIQLDEAEIRTNRERPSNSTILIIAVVLSSVLASIWAAGYVAYKKKTVPERRLELTETLNPET